MSQDEPLVLQSRASEALFRAVRTGNAFEETVERLLQAIRLGVVAPGERLPAERDLATRLGVAAIDAANDDDWGVMPALRGTRIQLVPLSEAVADLRTVPPEDYAAAEVFFG